MGTVKKVSILMMAVAVLCGCAVTESEFGEVGTKFQEGIQGRGQIVETNPTQDSFGPEFR